MQIKGLIDYTDTDLESLAARLLRDRVDVDFRIPVNVEKLLQNCPEVEVDVLPGLASNCKVEACICKDTNSKVLTIIVDGGIAGLLNRAAYNAAVTEELAHIELHKPLLIQAKGPLCTIELQRSPFWPQFEKDAKTLSAAIRMPPKNLILEAERAYREIVNWNGYGDMFAVMRLMRNQLASYFAVPPEDMQSRMLAWPWRIYDRVAMSVQLRSDRLVSANAQVTVREPKRQQDLFGDDRVLRDRARHS